MLGGLIDLYALFISLQQALNQLLNHTATKVVAQPEFEMFKIGEIDQDKRVF